MRASVASSYRGVPNTSDTSVHDGLGVPASKLPSATGVDELLVDAVLLLGSPSRLVLVTVAVVVTAAQGPAVATLSVHVAIAPFGMLPTFQVTVLPAAVAPQLLPVNVTPVPSTMLIATPVAGSGPSFWTPTL